MGWGEGSGVERRLYLLPDLLLSDAKLPRDTGKGIREPEPRSPGASVPPGRVIMALCPPFLQRSHAVHGKRQCEP